MIRLSLVDPEEGRDAWLWHSGFCASNDLVFPRTLDDYGRLAKDGQIWAAKDEKGKYLALSYFQLGRSEKYEREAWEIGGLMVANSQRKRGLGRTITCLTLGHVLTQYDPIAAGVTVVAHVHADNKPGPRPIFEGFLKFTHAKVVAIPGKLLEGLRTNNDGFVEGDEFELSRPATIKTLAGWCRDWKDELKDGEPATVDWGLEGSPELWAKALDNIAAR